MLKFFLHIFSMICYSLFWISFYNRGKVVFYCGFDSLVPCLMILSIFHRFVVHLSFLHFRTSIEVLCSVLKWIDLFCCCILYMFGMLIFIFLSIGCLYTILLIPLLYKNACIWCTIICSFIGVLIISFKNKFPRFSWGIYSFSSYIQMFKPHWVWIWLNARILFCSYKYICQLFPTYWRNYSCSTVWSEHFCQKSIDYLYVD